MSAKVISLRGSQDVSAAIAEAFRECILARPDSVLISWQVGDEITVKSVPPNLATRQGMSLSTFNEVHGTED